MHTSITQPPLGRPIPIPWCGRSKKEKKKRRKAFKKKNPKKREPIRLGEGVLRHSFSWLASLLFCTMHALVAISP
jgi:hypothetical protein